MGKSFFKNDREEEKRRETKPQHCSQREVNNFLDRKFVSVQEQNSKDDKKWGTDHGGNVVSGKESADREGKKRSLCRFGVFDDRNNTGCY
ncbi:MAG: hypothetical protein UX41_C0054G0004 [Candidatus Collierbacteria bacterium GW2011_GWE1_46_18]|uniref:Uncharacterized protein n=1 Tax=Candidatus Collierbacteria bacterium GW2011_GWE1_46_18 TaxID=1618399 RepID=A0A0G1S2G7_9BACT|nr:MAG: hypothetical protein UX41_C0054G0004 [Candidatus Collierbacteria bacterium GW2011_GWE1_46_18]